MRRKKSIKPLNNKGERHGYWELYYTGGELMYKGFYHNGKKVGYEEHYFFRGYKLGKKTYWL